MLFDTDVSGHHLEYIHHLYMLMKMRADCNYIIVVPEEFKRREFQYVWPNAENIRFDYIDNKTIERINSSSLLYSAFMRTILLSRYLRQYKVTRVFLVSLIGFIPFLPLWVSPKIRIIGIIYKIYLYEWNKYSKIRKALEVLKYLIITRSSCVFKVFILNDSSAVALLNKLYRVDKFVFLVDPFNYDKYPASDIRSDLGIPDNNIVFLHVGAMNRRKGTLTILKSLPFLTSERKQSISFIIAGVIRDDIKDEFYTILESMKGECQILLFDQYCNRRFIADLFKSSNCLLLPYEVTSQSSGLIGYAAYYHIPIIGPGSGLVGKLIRKFRLGKQIYDITPSKLACEVISFAPYRLESDYCNYATIDNFQAQIGNYF